MRVATAVKVPFIRASVAKCLCTRCPVQANSPSVSVKMVDIKNALSQNRLKRDDIPEVYCASGAATCQDIDTSESCICDSCFVFQGYDLASSKRVGHYCRRGAAK